MQASIDRLFGGLQSSSSALRAERVRLDVIAENLAGSRVTKTPEGGPYRRKVVRFEPLLRQRPDGSSAVVGVKAAHVSEDFDTPFEEQYNPGHPDANEQDMVTMPNVNPLAEMADMISASRTYEANLNTQRSFVQTIERVLQFARS
ncbi:MAG: flagellar basal body rod protein FlgC [Planctomycetota bacterium]